MNDLCGMDFENFEIFIVYSIYIMSFRVNYVAMPGEQCFIARPVSAVRPSSVTNNLRGKGGIKPS